MEAGMKRRMRRVVSAALWLGLWAAGATAFAAPDEVAKTRSTAGTSTVTHDGKTTNIGPTTELHQNDVVRVPASGRLTIEFEDQSSVTLIGPATASLGQMDKDGRRMMLTSGSISEATVHGKALEIQAPNPSSPSIVLQNARGAARVNPGDKIVFQKLEGNYAKVYQNGKGSDLGDAPWVLNIRSSAAAEAATEPPPARPAAATDRQKKYFLEDHRMERDRGIISNGVKPIVFYPASKFDRRRSADGKGFILTFYGGDDEWGVVEIGRETTIFVANGESVEFDADGNVVRFTGVAHEYRPLFDPIYSADPIQDAHDASPTLTRHH
jgi:hypothetical protein